MTQDTKAAEPLVQDTQEPAEGGRRRRRVPPYVISVLLLPTLIAVWWWMTEVEVISQILLPAPQDVLAAAPEVVGASGFSRHWWRTVNEIILGFALGGSVGFGLGLLLGSSNALRRAYLPVVSAIQAVPKVVLAPLIIAWFGFGISGKIVQAALSCFFAVFITTLSGLDLAEPDSIQLMRSLRASKWTIMRKVRIPSALPTIFGGIQMGATTAIIGGIVSEFVAADAGLGFLLLRYRSGFDTASAWVLIFIFLLFGIIAFSAVWFAERKIVFWRRLNVARPDLEQP